METKLSRVPFEVELAKKITNGEVKGRIVTRDGKTARIVCFDKKSELNRYPILALIENATKDGETARLFNTKGYLHFDGSETNLDLFLEVPEYMSFKDGDILFFENRSAKSIFIYQDIIDRKRKELLPNYVELRIEEHTNYLEFNRSSYSAASCRFATNEERKLLLINLKDYKPEYLRFFNSRERATFLFKKKDWVLTTGLEGDEWTLCQYSHFSAGGNHVFVGGTRSKICIPYNEKTEHLLGTTEKWEERNNYGKHYIK